MESTGSAKSADFYRSILISPAVESKDITSPISTSLPKPQTHDLDYVLKRSNAFFSENNFTKLIHNNALVDEKISEFSP